MHLKAMIMRTWRLSSSEFCDAVEGWDRATSEEYLESVTLEAEVQEGGEMGAETLFIA